MYWSNTNTQKCLTKMTGIATTLVVCNWVYCGWLILRMNSVPAVVTFVNVSPLKQPVSFSFIAMWDMLCVMYV